MIRDGLEREKKNKYEKILGYVYFDHDVCGEWENKWKNLYGDVNKNEKENECVYKINKKCINTKIWVDIVLERKKK